MTTNHSKLIDRNDIYKQAWSNTKANIRQYSLLILIVIIINIVNGGFDPESRASLSPDMEILTSILSIILSLASAWLSIGFINITLKLLHNKHTGFSDGIIDFGRTRKAFVANIFTSLSTIVGLVLLIVPGIIVQTRLMFVTTLILDKDMGIVDAIKTSWKMTKGYVWSLFMIAFVCQFLQILGILTLGIGLFRTIPFMSFAQTIAYRTIHDHK